MRASLLLLLLPLVVGVSEKFSAEVEGLQCTFGMVYKGSKVDLRKSKVTCSKPKKNVKFIGEVTSDSGTVFSITLMVTKKGARLLKASVSTGSSPGSGPTVGGSGSGRPPVGGSGSGRPPTGGSGSGRPPPGGSGSGRPPPYGSGSGRPPTGGSGSGWPPTGGSGSGGPSPPGLPDQCGLGFTRVCPSTGNGQCPARMAPICPGGGDQYSTGSGSGGNRPPGGSGGNRPPGGGGSGGNRPPSGSGSSEYLKMSPPVPPTATNMQCTCMPTLMVLMTKIAVEQMGGHGNGGGRPPMGGSGSGGSRPPYGSGSGRPPMGGSGSGSPPYGGNGTGGRPPMGGSGSGSGRPPMGGSGNRPPPSGRAAKPQLLKETFNHLVVVGKKSYECLFSMVYTVDRVDPRKSRAKCKGIKKGAVKQVTVTSPNGFSFTMDMKFSAKGVAMAKITVEASSSSSGSGGSSITGGSGRPPTGGSGSGRPPTGGSGSGRPPVGGAGSGRPPVGGSGSGSGGPPTGGIWDDMCFCVDEDVCNLPMPGGMGGGPQGS